MNFSLRKTPFQKRQEELERKRKRDAEADAAALADFVGVFGDDDDDDGGGAAGAGGTPAGQPLSSAPPPPARAPAGRHGVPPPAPHRAAHHGGPRAIDRMLEEMKKEEEERSGVVAAAPLPPPPRRSPPPPPDAPPPLPIVSPADPHLRFVIDVVAAAVVDDGAPLEAALIREKKNDPLFSFLGSNPPNPSDALYYRWRLASLSRGEGLLHWSRRPAPLVEGGPPLAPPPLPRRAAADDPPADVLTDDDAAALDALLNGLTLARPAIAAGMAFCLDRAAAAPAVAARLRARFETSADPPPSAASLAATLYLVADILANAGAAGVKGAWRYRSALADALIPAARALAAARAAAPSRMVAAGLDRAVERTVGAWGRSGVVEGDVVEDVRRVFDEGRKGK